MKFISKKMPLLRLNNIIYSNNTISVATIPYIGGIYFQIGPSTSACRRGWDSLPVCGLLAPAVRVADRTNTNGGTIVIPFPALARPSTTALACAVLAFEFNDFE